MEEIKHNLPDIVIEEALKYESIGFSVIPLGWITKNSDGKKEIVYPVAWKKYQSTRATPDEIKTWGYENIGIVSGKISKLLVLDLDIYKEGYDKELVKSLMLPITPTAQTASGGRQCYFRLPEGLVIKNDVCIGHGGSGVDIRGDGGMFIAPPTKTAYGEYTWLISPFGTPLADIPPKLLEILRQNQDDGVRERKELPELVGLREGEGRNNAMTSFIGKLLLTTRQDRWDDEVWPMVVEVNNTYKPPMDKDELMGIYKSITKIETERVNKVVNKAEVVPFIEAMTHAELVSRVFPLARFTIDPFFEQGTMNMVSAPPNTWKSWLLFYFAGHIVNGTEVLGKFSTEKANVMIVNEEDSARLIQDRLRLLNLTDQSLPIFYRIAQGSKLEPGFVSDLIAEAKAKKIGVIMFDSLRAIHTANENDSKEMQDIMDLFKKITRENITVIFTHHHKKKGMGAGKNDNAESSRGSTAINAAISGHISLEETEREEGKVLIVYHLKSKVGEKLLPFEVGVSKENGHIGFVFNGDHKPKDQAFAESKEKIISVLEERDELMGRKDFVYLNIGCLTTVNKVTRFLEKEEESIVKVITRKEAEKLGLKTLSKGKPNEKLYYIQKEGMEVPGQEDFDNLGGQ